MEYWKHILVAYSIDTKSKKIPLAVKVIAITIAFAFAWWKTQSPSMQFIWTRSNREPKWNGECRDTFAQTGAIKTYFPRPHEQKHFVKKSKMWVVCERHWYISRRIKYVSCDTNVCVVACMAQCRVGAWTNNAGNMKEKNAPTI